jgi:hypothetical protein
LGAGETTSDQNRSVGQQRRRLRHSSVVMLPVVANVLVAGS